MHLAALVDLGVPESWLREELQKLPVTQEFSLEIGPGIKMGISGTRAQVNAQDAHDHRHHSTIVKMIKQAGYSEAVEARALNIFAAIAKAEGKIHNVEPDKVHFHEVGAVDSIVDIVAAALCIEYLSPDVILCNPIEVGSGYVDCAHGRFPVPAPATQELLTGAPCTYGGIDGESTTPTGAAILSVSTHEYTPRGHFTPDKIGYGIGHKDFERPNVLRVALGSYTSGAASASPSDPMARQSPLIETGHVQVEANIDDMPAEAYEPLMQALFAAGADDVYMVPIVMKKSRPAHTLVALCCSEAELAVTDCLLNRSSTIGLRVFPFTKHVLPREARRLQTSMGEVGIKMVTQPDGRVRWKSEHDDVLALASAADRDYSSVKAQLDFEIRQTLDKE